MLLFHPAAESYAQQYWIEQPCPTQNSLLILCFSDSLYGWAAGDSGVIIHTSNGGANWYTQYEPHNPFQIQDMQFSDSRNGWALWTDYQMQRTMILHTTNSGNLWTQQIYYDTTTYLYAVYFVDSLRGFMGGLNQRNESVIYRTSNRGINWTKTNVNIGDSCHTMSIWRIKFYNSMTGYAMGGDIERGGSFWKTTDGGLNWIMPRKCISGEPIWDYYYVSSTRSILAGGDYDFGGSVYVTSNGGADWVFFPFNTGGIPHRIGRRGSNEFWLPMEYSGKFAISADTGSSWFFIDVQDSIQPTDVQFLSERNGWAIGHKGADIRSVIMKYNSAIIGIVETGNTTPVSFELYQNFPNPFNPNTTISFYVVQNTDVAIEVFDLTGRIIRTFNKEYQNAGKYAYNFSASDLASGIYLYRFRAKSGNQEIERTFKMVLLK